MGGDADAHPGSYVSVAVSDTGVGMDEHTRKRAMEPFFTTKPKGLGAGLGLAVVHGIVTQSGGWISMRSEPGSGTTFEMYLPRAGDQVDTGGPEQRELESRCSETVLVVEDEDGVRCLAAEVLKRSGYRVLTAISGEDGFWRSANAMGKPSTVLLTDVVMPGMTGRELAQRVDGSATGRTGGVHVRVRRGCDRAPGPAGTGRRVRGQALCAIGSGGEDPRCIRGVPERGRKRRLKDIATKQQPISHSTGVIGIAIQLVVQGQILQVRPQHEHGQGGRGGRERPI